MTREEKEIQKYIDEVEDTRIYAMDEATREDRKYVQLLLAAVLTYKINGKTFRFSDYPEIKSKAMSFLYEYRESLYAGLIKRFTEVIEISIKKNKTLYGFESDLPSNTAKKFISSELYDKTTKQRLSGYVDKILYEVEAYVSAGTAAGLSNKAIIDEYFTYMKKPFASPLIQKAIAKGDFNAIRLASKGVHFGTGISTSSLINIRSVVQDSIQNAFQFSEKEIYNYNGVKGYTIHRGSSYDCPICNYLPGKTYPMTEWILPAHPRCCCFSIPVV